MTHTLEYARTHGRAHKRTHIPATERKDRARHSSAAQSANVAKTVCIKNVATTNWASIRHGCTRIWHACANDFWYCCICAPVLRRLYIQYSGGLR